MLYNDKVLYNVNNGNSSIVMGKKYNAIIFSNLSTNSTNFIMSYDGNDNVNVYWGDETLSTYNGPFSNLTISKTYNTTGDYPIILECNYNNIKEIIFDSFIRINKRKILIEFKNLETIKYYNNVDIGNDISNVNLSTIKNIIFYFIKNNGNINTWILNNIEQIELCYTDFLLNLNYFNIPPNLTDLTFIDNPNFVGTLTNWGVFPSTVNSIIFVEITRNSNTYKIDITNWDTSNTNIKKIEIDSVEVIGEYNMNLPVSIEIFKIHNLHSNYVDNYFILDLNDLNLSNKINLKELSLSNKINVTGNITNLVLPDSLSVLSLSKTNIYGDFSTVTIPESLDNLYFNDLINDNFIFNITNFNFKNIKIINIRSNTNISGDIYSLISLPYIEEIDITITNISGIINMILPSSLTRLRAQNTNIIIDFDNIIFNNVSYLDISYCDSMGYIENCDISNITSLNIQSSNVNGIISPSMFNLSIYDINISNNNISGDITNLLNGTYNFSNLNSLYLFNNNISGDISGWSISELRYCSINSNNLTGNISNFVLNDYISLVNFSSLNITGTIGFMLNVFEKRQLYKSNVTSINIFLQNIIEIQNNPNQWTKEEPSKGTFQLHIFELTEAQVNNLSNGLDYDGNGNNTPWTSGQMAWWMENAKNGETGLKRYKNFKFYF